MLGSLTRKDFTLLLVVVALTLACTIILNPSPSARRWGNRFTQAYPALLQRSPTSAACDRL